MTQLISRDFLFPRLLWIAIAILTIIHGNLKTMRWHLRLMLLLAQSYDQQAKQTEINKEKRNKRRKHFLRWPIVRVCLLFTFASIVAAWNITTMASYISRQLLHPCNVFPQELPVSMVRWCMGAESNGMPKHLDPRKTKDLSNKLRSGYGNRLLGYPAKGVQRWGQRDIGCMEIRNFTSFWKVCVKPRIP